MSIQSLIMDNEILAKEPGCESYGVDDPENQAYCQVVKYGNVRYAMLEMLKAPPAGFETVVRTHFKLNRDRILTMLDNWVEESKSVTKLSFHMLTECQNHTITALFRLHGYKQMLALVVDELKAEIAKL